MHQNKRDSGDIALHELHIMIELRVLRIRPMTWPTIGMDVGAWGGSRGSCIVRWEWRKTMPAKRSIVR